MFELHTLMWRQRKMAAMWTRIRKLPVTRGNCEAHWCVFSSFWTTMELCDSEEEDTRYTDTCEEIQSLCLFSFEWDLVKNEAYYKSYSSKQTHGTGPGSLAVFWAPSWENSTEEGGKTFMLSAATPGRTNRKDVSCQFNLCFCLKEEKKGGRQRAMDSQLGFILWETLSDSFDQWTVTD